MAELPSKEVVVESQLFNHGSGSVEEVIDSHLEARLVRKMDLHIIPIIMLIQLVSFLDRSNIGNAKVAGLTTDLNLKGTDFNVAASIFYVTYIVFEVPYNILQRRIGAKKVIPAIVIAWSLVTIFSGFMQTYGGLLASRLMLGLCEAGLFPGLNFYISTLYKREELAKRVCVLLVATALSGAFGGLIAYGVLQMNGVGGIAGWRWLFYIEGIISFVVGVAAFFLLPSNADTAYFLTQEEKNLARLRMAQSKQYVGDDTLRWKEIRSALTSPVCWVSGCIQIGCDVCLYGFSTFLPTIIQGMGYKSLSIQYLTIPIYVWGAFTYLCIAWCADRYQKRAVFQLTFGTFTIIGYIILITATKAGVLYFATFLCSTGLYMYGGLNITWISGNTAGQYKRATAIGLNQMIGNIGGAISGQIYITTDAPRYVTGQAVSLSAFAWSMCWTVVMYFMMRRKNAEKAKKIAAGVEEDENDVTLGDESIHFKYML